MDTRTAVERLEFSNCAPYPFHHIYYERFYHGKICERRGGWDASIHEHDFGFFTSFEAAKQAVIAYYRGLDIESGE